MAREPGPELVKEVKALYDQGRFVDALAGLSSFDPMEQWVDCDARLLASRLLGNLGSLRRAQTLSAATWRKYPNRPDTFYYYALGFVERHGPYEGLRLLQERHPTPPLDLTAVDRHDVFTWLLRAQLLAAFRDFAAAENWLGRAITARPDDAWTHVATSTIREAQDRYEDAVASCLEALRLAPLYRPAVERYAHVLSLSGREAEAITVLQDALKTFQSGNCAQQLACLYLERGDNAAAREALGLAERFLPLAEKPLQRWLKARQSEVHYRLGDFAAAKQCASEIGGDYYQYFVERVSDFARAAAAKRVLLPVGFVRQHHMTCAPATLSALSVYWKRPIDHLALAQVITYDGTPDHEERHWMESQGWIVREFRVTWEIAQTLLDRGIPFTVVSTAVRSAHLQAVVGYDGLLETLIIRDPYHRQHGEYLASSFLTEQAPYGPRGMVMLPPEEIARLDGVELPEAELYDLWFALRRALTANNRQEALAQAEALWSRVPESRQAWWARRELAYFDQAPLRMHEAICALRKMYPDEPNLRLEEIAVLQQLGRHSERLDLLKASAVRRSSHPVFWREYTEALRGDAREHDRARRYARRLMRVQPVDWLNLVTYGNVLRDTRDYARASRVHRLAAMLGDKVEPAWETYFTSARLAGEIDQIVALLQKRWEQLGASSALPGITLCRCLDQLGRGAEASAILQRALTERTNDPDLQLFAAEFFGRHGNFKQAREQLAAASGARTPRWLTVAALISSWQAEYSAALEYWREAIAINPLHHTALHEIPRLLHITAGRDQSLQWIREQVERFPHFLPLRQLHVQWLRPTSLPAAIAEINVYLNLHAEDAWALREKAVLLTADHQFEAALPSAMLAEMIDPHAPASGGILGHVLLGLRRFDEARSATQRALRQSIDAEWLLPQLLETCPTFAERREAVAFLLDQLKTQPSLGESFLRFREVATGVLPPEELRTVLASLRETQPHHWQAWSACIQQAIALGQSEVALALAQQATRRFPLIPRLWVDLADVYQLLQDSPAEIQALTHTLELSPGWSWASLRLCSRLLRDLRRDDAERVLRTALTHDPVDPRLLTEHAELLWQSGQRDPALASLERAIAAAPSYEHPWNLLQDWSEISGDQTRALRLARRLVEQRSGDAEAHLRLARVLAKDDQLDAAIEQIQASLTADPALVDAHDSRAWVLSRLGRYAEAIEACHPPIFGAVPPVRLRGRAAWTEWQRGNRSGAIAQMRAVVKDAPDYSWAWQSLADWLDVTGKTGDAAEAAAHFAELNPGSPYPLGYIADLKIKAGDKRGAADALRRALAIEPNYLFAAVTLIKLLAENAEYAEAEQVLGLIRQHGTSWRACQSELVLARWKKDAAAAERCLRQLCLAPEDETRTLSAAVTEFRAAFSAQRLSKVLEQALTESQANAEVGAFWMQHQLETHRWFAWRKILRSSVRPAVQRRAWVTYLEWLGDHRRRLPLFWHLHRRAELFRAVNETWAAVSYALAQTGRHRATIRWMHDWAERPEVKPWMLSNLVLALQHQDRRREAAAVIQKALRLPADHTRSIFVAWAGLGRAEEGDFAEAKAWLETFDPVSSGASGCALAEVARAWIAVGTATGPERRGVCREQRARLKALRAKYEAAYGLCFVRRAERRALRAICAMSGEPWLAYWYAIPRVPPRFARAGLVVGGVAAVVLMVGALIAAAGASAGSGFPVGGIGLVVALISAAARKRR